MFASWPGPRPASETRWFSRCCSRPLRDPICAESDDAHRNVDSHPPRAERCSPGCPPGHGNPRKRRASLDVRRVDRGRGRNHLRQRGDGRHRGPHRLCRGRILCARARCGDPRGPGDCDGGWRRGVCAGGCDLAMLAPSSARPSEEPASHNSRVDQVAKGRHRVRGLGPTRRGARDLQVRRPRCRHPWSVRRLRGRLVDA